MKKPYPLPYQPIRFDEEHHKYYDHDGIEYKSVTRLIKGEKVFDSVGVAKQVVKNPRSRYYKYDVDELVRLWNTTSGIGIKLHGAIENYIDLGTIDEDPVLKPLVEKFTKLKFAGTLMAEVVVHHPEYRIAGTVDILEELPELIWVWDIKTVTAGSDGHVSDEKIMNFSIQLEIYRRLIEYCFKKPCLIGGVIWFKDYLFDEHKAKMKVLQVEDCGFYVDELLRKRKKSLNS